MITPVSPSFLKQEAKKLKKQRVISMSEALDEISRKFGFSNYKHYLNLSEANFKQSIYDKENLISKLSSEKDKFKKIDIAVSSIKKFKISFSDQLDILKLFQNLDNPEDSTTLAVCEKLKLSEDLRYPDYGVQPSLQLVCERLNLMKAEIQAYFLKEADTDEERSNLADIHPDIIDIEAFIPNKASIRNLIYQIDNDTLNVDGDYKITYKYDGEKLIPESEEHPHYDYFKNEYHKDRKMAGSFGVTINRDKKITIVHADMGY